MDRSFRYMGDGGGHSGQIPPSDRPAQGFVSHEIQDPCHRMTVSTIEHPRDWEAVSRVEWNSEDTSCPVRVTAAVANPHGTESVGLLPLEAYFWVEPNYVYAVGQKSHGLVCLPPASAPAALVQYAIPRYRGDRRGLRVVGVRPFPDLARAVGATEVQQHRHEGVVARVEYDEGGRTFEEEFYACCYWLPPNMGQLNWGLTPFFCLRAERGRLDAARPTLWRVAASARPNPEWQQLYRRITDWLAEQHRQLIQFYQDKLRAERELQGRLSAYYAQQRQQQSDNVAWGVERDRQRRGQGQQPAYTNAEAFGDALMGRVAYADPNSAYGNYHYEYNHPTRVQTDMQGGWASSDDPNFDANRGPRGNWTDVDPLNPRG